MRLSKYFLFLLLSNPFYSAFAQSELPSCANSFTDQDGDGYGFENSATCIVDATTRSTNDPNICVDDDADGYGWNGFETCLIEVVPNPDCEDTSPIGDGWGWNGVSSCRVVPQISTPMSELEILKSKLTDIVGRDRNFSAFYCPEIDVTMHLGINGFLFYFVGTELVSEGMWSTGMFDLDSRLSVQVFSLNPQFATINEQSVEIFGTTCDWFD